MTPELKARQGIDRLLSAAGWHVCDWAQANIHAVRGVAVRNLEQSLAANKPRALIQMATGSGKAVICHSFAPSKPRSKQTSSARKLYGKPLCRRCLELAESGGLDDK